MGKPINGLEIQTHYILTKDVERHRHWFTGLGVVLFILGITAIAFPWVATLSIDIIVGVLLLTSGLAQLFHSFSVPRWRGTLTSFVLSGLAITTGLLMLFFPLAGIITLTMLVTLFFLLSGIAKCFLAIQIRPAIGWGWTMMSGLISLGIAIFILLSFDEVLPWLLGLVVGIDLIVTGVWMMALASSLKKTKG